MIKAHVQITAKTLTPLKYPGTTVITSWYNAGLLIVAIDEWEIVCCRLPVPATTKTGVTVPVDGSISTSVHSAGDVLYQVPGDTAYSFPVVLQANG